MYKCQPSTADPDHNMSSMLNGSLAVSNYCLWSLSSNSLASAIGEDGPCPPAEAPRPGAAILLPL